MPQAALSLPAFAPRQDFSAATDRARLSATALKAYRRLIDAWGLTGQQAAALLDVSTSTWERLKQAGKAKPLSQDQLTAPWAGAFGGAEPCPPVAIPDAMVRALKLGVAAGTRAA